MYLFAGCMTMAWSFIVWWKMPDDIPRAKFLSDREKEIAQERIRRNNGGSRGHDIKWDQVKEAFLDINVWGLFVLAMGAYFASGVLQSFSSLIISDLGFDTLENLAGMCEAIIGSTLYIKTDIIFKSKFLKDLLVSCPCYICVLANTTDKAL